MFRKHFEVTIFINGVPFTSVGESTEFALDAIDALVDTIKAEAATYEKIAQVIVDMANGKYTTAIATANVLGRDGGVIIKITYQSGKAPSLNCGVGPANIIIKA